MQGAKPWCDVCNVELPGQNDTSHFLGKKHLGALQDQEKRKSMEEKGVFVNGYPRWLKEEELKRVFTEFGTIERFVFNETFAIVQFQHRESAQLCLSRRLCCNGHPLNIKERKVRAPVQRKAQVPPNIPSTTPLGHEEVASALSRSDDSFEVQLSTLLNEIHLTDYKKYNLVCHSLESTFSSKFPGCRVYPFGSTVTGLAFKGSDLDVYMDTNDAPEPGSSSTPKSPSDKVKIARSILRKNHYYFADTFAIPNAKTPIVKFVHKPTKIACDLNFKNALGVNNSGLIKHYLSMDPRLQPLLLVIKYWASKNELTGHGKMSNYALIMISLFYTQQMDVPIIPAVAELQKTCKERLIIGGWDCSIDKSVSFTSENTMTVPELLCGFFKFYSQFDYGIKVMCPLVGSALPKTLFQKPEELPEVMKRYKENVTMPDSGMVGLKFECDMCIQDPFELNHNLTSSTNSKVLEIFKKYCAAAAQACEEAIAGGPSLLTRLFIENVKPALEMTWCKDKAYIRIPLGKHTTPAGSDEVDFTEDIHLGDTVDELRRRWCKRVLDLLVEIFERVMKFEVSVEDAEHSVKVPKLEGQADVSVKVSDSKTGFDWKIIHCSGKHRLWEGRKGTSKKLKLSPTMSPLLREITISDFMLERKPFISFDEAVVNFRCVFRLEKFPTRAVLEFSDERSCVGEFKCAMSFLQSRLRPLIEKCLMQQHDEQSVKEEPA